MAPPHPRIPVHYGWVIIFAGLLTMFACLGLGRFALGMQLPSMSRGLTLSNSQMGVISTGNFLGYLAGVLACGRLVGLLGARRVIFGGLLAVGASMVLVSFLSSYPAILGCYLVTGFGSALANVAMMGLIAHWFSPWLRGRAAGMVIAGNGVGIMVSGVAIPLLNAAQGASGWRAGWGLLGALVLATALVCGLLLRNDPAGMQLAPLGAGAAPTQHREQSQVPVPPTRLWPLLLHLGAIYLAFGFTYVIYATFIVTTLVRELGYSVAAAGRMWVWIGLLSLVSGPVFGGLSDRIGRRGGLVAVFALQACAYLLVGLRLPGAGVYLSIALFGLAVWGIPSIITATVGDYLPREMVTTAFGYVTFIFGCGQMCGPALAGYLADATGSFAGSYLLAAATCLAGIFLALLLRPPARRPAASLAKRETARADN